ncbi:MAG: hypothetical protein HOJ15_02120 [Candidatus Jacksonbacteria bacterium]|jgi:hypothetical protein|nr:hypothetical protein [Candidatus Jacksonbacteria bacterium]MBT6034763.1 hypothetical protein [Candidatus Jacksonbacteria bacterium]MBT6301201.1 hypothetical protein [Candidatus Jacksonbacteria bacterium]MBT6757052.1 hypothetical protein [Candidatus Jacksonbacteria bacterium]MBT6954804.1 hypothetical protein [Candidatus Jacksonbacteria bacterium]
MYPADFFESAEWLEFELPLSRQYPSLAGSVSTGPTTSSVKQRDSRLLNRRKDTSMSITWFERGVGCSLKFMSERSTIIHPTVLLVASFVGCRLASPHGIAAVLILTILIFVSVLGCYFALAYKKQRSEQRLPWRLSILSGGAIVIPFLFTIGTILHKSAKL